MVIMGNVCYYILQSPKFMFLGNESFHCFKNKKIKNNIFLRTSASLQKVWA